MFMADKLKKISSISKTYSSGCVLPVLTAAELFSSSRHQGVLRQLYDMTEMEAQDYERFYQDTLNHFAEFVQVMPTQVHGPLSNLLNESLSLAVIAVKEYHTTNDETDPLVMYAIFTAALFRDVARVVTNHKVIVCEEGGSFIDEWSPFAGSMADAAAEFYKLYPLAPIYQRLDKSLTPLLARQLMPKVGFLWIASDLQLYADWLDVLTGEGSKGGRVSHVLSTVRPQDVQNLINALVPVDVEIKSSVDTQYGDLFYAWLKDEISKGELSVNTADAGVQVTADGVFLERNKVFHQFAEATKVPVNMNVVFTQFGNLFGIASKGGGDFVNAQYFSKYPAGMNNKSVAFSSLSTQRSLQGPLVDAAMVFMTGKVPAATNMLRATRSPISATHQIPTQAQIKPGPKMK